MEPRICPPPPVPVVPPVGPGRPHTPPQPPPFPVPPHCAIVHPRPYVPRPYVPLRPPPRSTPTHALPPRPVVHHTATAMPKPLPAPEVAAAPGAPEAAFVYVAITIPALVAAGTGAFHQIFGRGR
ncbi:hypothetical protein [Streptacidiphilus jiangxiensis]|uniref:Formin 2/protein TonB n=1 Tax=Streptacidiphilus jiangxiensis TaxID=235985 RepID=A0A1H7X2D8_STRJI|nr:hypothetical protein [Streptacidiphilus jiangxiensis]SEM27745.1 formin 2/protein TonB [Streptacidiphilus jiangxiensis]